jgi:hypothetical protein
MASSRSSAPPTLLEALFAIDSRYRVLWEIGIGINTELEPLPGNAGMNETYGAEEGVVHWGLGLTPYTQYALILLTPECRVLDSQGATLAGPGPSRGLRAGMVRRKAPGCGCIEA